MSSKTSYEGGGGQGHNGQIGKKQTSFDSLNFPNKIKIYLNVIV